MFSSIVDRCCGEIVQCGQPKGAYEDGGIISLANTSDANTSDMVTVDKIVELTAQRSIADKLRLIERIVPQIDREVKAIQKPQSLRGIWRGLDATDEDIQSARAEMWRNFPRDDI